MSQLKIVIQKCYVNDGIILEDGKLLFLNTEEILKKEYFGLQKDFLSMDAQDLFLWGKGMCYFCYGKENTYYTFFKTIFIISVYKYWKEKL